MPFWPTSQNTLVLTLSAEEIVARLRARTVPRDSPGRSPVFFSGWVSSDRFRLMRFATRVNPFQAVAHGRLESPSSGCILLLEFHWLPVTRLLLITGSLLAILLSVMYAYQSSRPVYIIVALTIIILIAAVGWLNFRIHQKDLLEHILAVLR